MLRLIRALIVGVLLAIFSAACSQTHSESTVKPANITFAQSPLVVGNQQITVELARTPVERRKGLSHRNSLSANKGMLFIYKDSRIRHFTMRETLIPLAIAFITENGEILQIIEMQAGEEQSYPSRLPAMYALEMNAGWFENNGIFTGQMIDLAGIQ